MVIRDHESICGNERATAAGVESDTGLLQMLKPLRCRFELIFFLRCFRRRGVKSPIPSAARAENEPPKGAGGAMEHSFREIMCQHKMPRFARQLRPFF